MSERPRDRLGRPLPRDDPAGFPGVTPRAEISSGEAITEARDYLARGLPFHAHEVLEMRWRCCPAEERDLWRALAQAGAAATHAARGNPIGAQRLLERARATLTEWQATSPGEVDGLAPLIVDLGL